MKRHLLKLVAFGAVQLALFAALRGVPQPRTAVSAHAPALVGDARLEAYLREWLYPYWLVAPGTLDRLAAAPPDSRILAMAAEGFLNGPDDYLAALIDKAELLRSAPGRRMIFVGGSGLAFGLDSELIAARYGYTPINLGLHIRLGPEFLLRLTQAHLRPGDVVVLCFEYDGMMREFKTTPDRAEEIRRLSDDFEQYLRPDDDESESVLERLAAAKRYSDRDALSDLAADVRRSASGLGGHLAAACLAGRRDAFDAAFTSRRDELIAAFRRSEVSQGREVYQRSSFNAYGDLTGHRLRQPSDAQIAARSRLAIPAPLPNAYRSLIAANVDRLNAFAAACEARGVRTVLCHSPLPDCPTARVFGPEYAALVDGKLAMPVLCSVEDSIYSPEHFYDSPNHLNWEGTCRRMASLARGLDRHVPPLSADSVDQQIAARARAVRGNLALAVVPDERQLR